jgi:hypothetical protein
VGGTFGTSGGAFLSRDNYLVVEGAKNGRYLCSEVVALVAEQEVERKLSFLSILIGLILTVVLTVFFNIFGLIFGLIITFYFSKYKTVDNFVDVVFKDGENVRLRCTPRQVKKLVRFKG